MVAVFDQPADTAKGVIRQAMDNKRLFAAGPAAVQIVTGRPLKAQAVIERRIA